ncbi:FAD-dependent monooxygenase [Altererythrobacter sp. CC-YST694]|uniref:FAD-dependent monooxygenase n=1 Tax=Altererythrobacter sp. CC-YST694 TaxID=2755038 RepID=UPI001D01610B|nr:FAD-dependent monooxygenase [Altererythrobacter sp. CC-YST694]MCB5423637.1 FAD-dependent monooxygenase [Altererythrobacter sp. CC-YST694]
MADKPRITIAGGGIGGMAAALSLLRRGYPVQVFEQAPELGEVGAGVQISPNGSRALDSLGVFEALRAQSCAPKRKEFRLWNTGRAWPMFDLGPVALEKYGYPYLTVFRPDLLATLYDAVRAIDPNAVHLGCEVVDAEADDDSAVLVLKDGRRIESDVLIGADGVKSNVRKNLFGDDHTEFTGMIAWRAVIPMERLPERFHEMVGWTWIGPGGHLVNYPLRGGKLMNMIGTIERNDWQVESWYAEGSIEECANDFAGWHEDVQTLIHAAPKVLKWAFMERPPRQIWSKGRASLLGDACHATLPFLAQGAVMSIEDGVVLGRCLDKYADPVEALKKYEQARVERTSKMVRGAKDNTARFHEAALKTEEGAVAYMESEWSRDPIKDRYDWLYRYDVETAEI